MSATLSWANYCTQNQTIDKRSTTAAGFYYVNVHGFDVDGVYDHNRIIKISCSCASSGDVMFQGASTEAEPGPGRSCQAASVNAGCHGSTHFFLAGKKGGCSTKMSPTAIGATVSRVEKDLVSVHSDEFDSKLNVPASWIQECSPGRFSSLKLGYGIKSYYRSENELITGAIDGVVVEMDGATVHVQFDQNPCKQWVPIFWIQELTSTLIDGLQVRCHVSTDYCWQARRAAVQLGRVPQHSVQR